AAIKRWIATAKTANTEDLVFRLHLAHEIGLGPEQRDSFVNELLKAQKASGGWAQNSDMKADAYATGSALVALHEAGEIPCDHPAWRRGLAYLLESQEPDGSWHVVTRAKPIQEYFESGFPHGRDQFISAFATGWAAEALLLSLRPETKD
ncbi:MAG: prenyltransferase/squalene oxidase repeat-containing protein, partial [Chthoniobacteraceae bacterium]